SSLADHIRKNRSFERFFFVQILPPACRPAQAQRRRALASIPINKLSLLFAFDAYSSQYVLFF
ncbi:hypothetical protein, partial [Scandinavium lactucae]